MKKSFTLLLLLGIFAYFVSCKQDEGQQADKDLEDALNSYSKTGSYQGYIMPDGIDLSALPNQDPKNPVTQAKVQLGKMLFFETGIGLENKYPCNSGHPSEFKNSA